VRHDRTEYMSGAAVSTGGKKLPDPVGGCSNTKTIINQTTGAAIQKIPTTMNDEREMSLRTILGPLRR